jgi:hypothetical protein
MSTDYDPFSVFPDIWDKERRRKQINPNDFRFGEIGAAVSDFPQAEMAKRGVNLQAPKVDPVLPQATDYDPFATFRQSRTAVEQPDPSILFPRSRGPVSDEPNLGVLGESFGVYSPQDQQNWLKAEKQAAQGMISGAQERLRNRRAMGMSPDDDLLGADETRQATASIKQGQTRLKELAAMERGELALPIKSGLRSAVENFPRSVAETMISIPQMAGIIKGYVQDGPVDDEYLLNWSRGAKDWVARQFPGDPARQDEFAQQLATGAGSLVSFYGVGILARLAKLSQPAQIGIVSAFGGSASGTQGFEEATRELQQARAEAAASGDQPAIDDYDRLLKTLGYSAVGLTEAAPIARTLTRAVPNAQTRLGQRLIQGAEGAAEEAVQESGAQLAQNVISQHTTDPERAAMAGVGESAAVGGTLGGLMNFLMPGRFSPDQGGGQTGGQVGPYPQLPPPDNWDWLNDGVEDRGPLTPLEDLPIGGEPDPSAPLALPDLNAPERNALKAEMSRLLNASPPLAAQADQFLSAVDEPGPTQNVVQAALQKVRDTGKLSAVANELIQTMRPAMAQMPSPQTPQEPQDTPDVEVRDQFAAPGTAGRVQTSPFQEQTPGQTQTLDREPLTLPSAPLSEEDILPAIGPGVPSRDIDDLGFYSQALESARTLPQATGTPEQMLAQIEKGGTKEAEIRATDLDKFLFGEPLAQQRRQLVDLRTEANALRSEMGQKDPEITPARRAEIEAELARIQPLLATGEDEFRQAMQNTNLPRRIARDDLVGYLDQNRVRLQQSRYGGKEAAFPSLREYARVPNEDGSYDVEVEDRESGNIFVVNVDDDAGNVTVRGPDGEYIPVNAPMNRQRERHAMLAIQDWLENQVDHPEDVTGPAKWEKWSLDPGNPTYRENVVHLPIPESAPQFDPAKVKIERRRQSTTQGSATISYDGKVLLDGAEDSAGKPDSYWIDYARRVFEKGDRFNRLEPMQPAFRQGHFEEPNVVSHYRTQQLQTVDGRTVLNGDEFQSDWGQKIREGGARDEAKIAELKKQLEETDKQLRELSIEGDRRYRDHIMDPNGDVDDNNRLLNFFPGPSPNYIDRIEAGEFGLSPKATGDWLFRAGQETANEEFGEFADKHADKIAAAFNTRMRIVAELATANAATPAHPLVRTTDQWLATTLRKFVKDAVDAGVDGVTITPGDVQNKRYPGLIAVADEMEVEVQFSSDDRLIRLKKTGRPTTTIGVNSEGTIVHSSTSELVGHSLSEVIGREPADLAMGTPHSDVFDVGDLEIGGEGMRATYDKIYPRALAKILQKYDKSVKPERVKLLPHKIAQQTDILQRMQAEGKTFEDYPYNALSDNDARIVKQDFIFFPITDKVRQKVKEEGQPLFALGPGGQDERRSKRARDRAGRDQGGSLAPLKGAPTVEDATGPDPRVVAVAERYARDHGIPLKRQAEYAKINPELAARIATAYDQMPHAPNDPKVAAAYQAMIEQTVDQYKALKADGYKFWFYDEGNDPYAGNPWNAIRDLRQNQSMAVFATEAGFGSGATDVDTSTSPLLVDSGIQWPYGAPDGPMKRVLVNDLFRAVHDVFGHSMEGAGFRAQGEENAWQAHIRLYTGLAQGAMTSETRGQNSWLNFGPYGENNRTASLEDTVFGDQKSGLMPEWTWAEGRVADQDSPLASVPTYALENNPQAAIDALRIGGEILQDWLGNFAQVSPEGVGPGPDAALAAVSAITQSGQRTMEALRRAMVDAGFKEPISDEVLSQGLLAANFLMAPETKEGIDPLFAITAFPITGNAGRMAVLQRQQNDIFNQIDTLQGEIKDLIGGKANDLTPEEEAAYNDLASQIDALNERLPEVERELNDLYDKQHDARVQSGLFEKRSEAGDRTRQAFHEKVDLEKQVIDLEQKLEANPNDFQTRRQLQLAQQRLSEADAVYSDAQAELDKINDDLANLVFALRGFYSPAIRAVETAKQDKATPEQWKKVLTGPGVRQEEVRWLGVMDWLDEQASMMVDRPGSNQPKSEKTIAKSDVIDFLRAHQYEIEQRILLSERDPDDIPEDERVDDDDEPADVMDEEERDEWISERAQEIQNELESEAIQEQIGTWEQRNDPSDYDVEIQFEDFTGTISDAEQELLEVERRYSDAMDLYRRALDAWAASGEVFGQIPLPGLASPRPVEPRFETIAERVLTEDTLEDWRNGNLGWVVNLEHPYDREDEELENGDVFPTRQAAQEAANARLEAIRDAYDEELEAARQDIYEQDFAYEYDQAHQQAERDFEDEYGDGVRRSGDYFSDQTRYKQYRIKGGRHYQEMLVRLPMLEGKYSSHHYQDQEVVHIRYDVRTGLNGEKVLFIHEIQSDLHQRARAFGFGKQGLERAKKVHEDGGVTPELGQALEQAAQQLYKVREELHQLSEQRQDHPLVQTIINEAREAEAKVSEVNARIIANREAASTYISTFARFDGAPEAPYTGTAWWELGFKAALQRAVEKGFDGVALTTPAQIREATYTPEKVAQKFYGENVPKFINKYVKKWGSKPEKKMLSGTDRRHAEVLRPNYTVDDFVKWLNALKNQTYYMDQGNPAYDGHLIRGSIDLALETVASPDFNGDISSVLNGHARLFTRRTDNIPAYWRRPSGELSIARVAVGDKISDDAPSPYHVAETGIEQPYWPITDQMRKDLSGEGTGQPLAIGQEQILRGIDTLLAAGRSVTIGENVKDAILNAIEPHRVIVPSGLSVGYLSRIEPVKGNRKRVNAYFTTEDGSSHVMEYDRDGLLGLRAFFQPPNGALPTGIFFLRTTTQGEFQRGVVGEIRHEAIHALRRSGRLPDHVWSALVGHARKLQVMDISFADYLDAIGRPTQDFRAHAVSVGDQYRSFYSGRSDFQEVFEQEAVAHLSELYSHDAWTQEEIAPVKDILDDIFAGRYSGASPDPRGGGQDLSYALRPVDREGQPIKNDPRFKAFFKQSAAVDEMGEPKILYHATLADFPAFDPRRTQVESNLGRGFYFTDSPDDSSANYGRAIGPDIEGRITNLAERLNSDAGLEYNDPHGFNKAREQLGYVHEGMNLPVYLSIQNPVVISDPYSGIESTFLPYQAGEIYDEETDDYEYGEPSGKLDEFFEALRQVAPDYNNIDVEAFIADLMDDVFINEGLTAEQIYNVASNSDFLIYGEDPESGQLSTMEPIRRAYEMIGYDGIIDHTVDEKFPTMQGIQGATHYIVFKPEQIKSVFNAGGFDPDDPNILAAIGGEKKGARSRLTQDMLLLVRNGLAAPVPIESAKPVFDAIRPAQDMVPSEYIVANISGIYPDQDEPNQAKPEKILFDFKTEDGKRFTLRLPPHYIRSSAFHAILPEMQNRPATSGIFFVNLTPDGGSSQYLRGVIRHEAVHALRTKNRIPEAIWLRLLDHAEKLRVMDHSLGSYLEATGITDTNSKDHEVSIYDSYHDLYKANTRFYQEFIDQEQIAHMVELYEHGVFTPQEIAPVKHILDAMFRGDFSRGTPNQARTLSVPEPDYHVPDTIVKRLREITNATQPARSDPGQPGAAQAGAGAPQGLSPADRITPTREDFGRSSLIGESLGRGPIDDRLRQSAIRTYLGNWWKADAPLKRAKLQGFTLPAWHATPSDFLVPNPNIKGRDFGFHVAINTPNAANERAGFSFHDVDNQLTLEKPGMIGKLARFLSNAFWDNRKNIRNLPLLVKARNPLRVPDLNAWGSMPMWRGAIQEIMAGQIPDIGPKNYPVFRAIDDMMVAVMTEKALVGAGFDEQQTFRQALVNILESHGYDSLIYKNDYEDVGNDSLFLWDAARVRSAFDTFDPRADGNPGLYASVPFMEADMRQELNRALREEGLEEIMPQFALGSADGGSSVEGFTDTNSKPMTELYTDYLKRSQKSGKKPISFKEFSKNDARITL